MHREQARSHATERVGVLRSIYRYPVKSMIGESLDSAALTTNGIPGDRGWAVRDETRGGIRGAKHFAGLMQCAARLSADGTAPEIALPTGERFFASDPDAAERMSAFLGNPVTLWPLLPKEMVDHYRRGAPLEADMMTELRRIFARTADEPLPDLSRLPEILRKYESPPGTYFDAFPVLLLTRQSLATLAQRAPTSRFDVRRFRPTLLVDVESRDPFPERAWVGKRVRIGATALDVAMDCPRCVMTTLPFADLPNDSQIMRTLVRECDGMLGVYAMPVESGTLRVGDAVALA